MIELPNIPGGFGHRKPVFKMLWRIPEGFGQAFQESSEAPSKGLPRGLEGAYIATIHTAVHASASNHCGDAPDGLVDKLKLAIESNLPDCDGDRSAAEFRACRQLHYRDKVLVDDLVIALAEIAARKGR